jgi:hypothetical protein
MGAWAPAPKHGGDPNPKARTMRGNPVLNFQRAAEAAGYPALLIVSMLCLAFVVLPIALLALTQAGWVLGLALLSLIAAVATMAAAVEAAFSDSGEPARGRAGEGGGAPGDRDLVAPLPRRRQPGRQAGDDRRAA